MVEELLLHSPHTHPHPHSPSSTASSSLSSSPISSPVLAKRLGSPGFHPSSYQAGVNQRFQAARHKFQSQAELEQQHGGPLSPRDLSPTTSSIPPPPEHSTAKQLARNTVTQVLSRFTSQQAGVKAGANQQLSIWYRLPQCSSFSSWWQVTFFRASVSRHTLPPHSSLREDPSTSDPSQEAWHESNSRLPSSLCSDQPLPRADRELWTQQQWAGGCQGARPGFILWQLTK
ncbi:CTTNBP2 N-terminal-like protein [Larimichthys crocea]|uniref:Uncharacterized protein n=1 Tax=Larimichthys crocea TaxID=215358 RepID=A0ACD3RD19_LARCR|nr:CTTNBP2 N-terminal-like protein [Larimichthys crocea]